MRLVHAKRVITGVGDEAIDDGAILTADGKIVAVGPFGEVKRQAKARCEVLELGDLTVVPGLFDCHVHLCFDGGPDPVRAMREQGDEQQLVLMLKNARELLGAGVTTARDLGARGRLAAIVKEAIDNDLAPGPELIVANQPITTTGGHFWFMGGEADGIDELKKAVRERHKTGASVIKVMCTGGFLTQSTAAWMPQYSLEELQAIVAEARRLNMGVAAHAHGTEGIKLAAQAGVSTIEHCSWVIDDSSGFGMGPSSEGYAADVATMLASRGIPVSAMYVRLQYFPESRQKIALERFAMMRESGVRFIVGTDSGIDDMPHREFGLRLAGMARCGFTPAEILKAATVDSADALGVSARKGSIEVGKDCDLVAFAEDPTVDIASYLKCKFVMTRGNVANT